MQIYQTKAGRLKGTDFTEVRKRAFFVFKQIKKKSKRHPYIRSAYFNKEKIFLNLFWQHLFEKPLGERLRRLKYFAAAVELLEGSRSEPELKMDPSTKEQFYRFSGRSKEGDLFYVQIKCKYPSNNKHLISIFPAK
jgi:hypothetical protein